MHFAALKFPTAFARAFFAQRANWRKLAANEVARGAALSLTITAVAAIMTFAMFAVLARSMDEAGFGHLAGWLNAVSLLTVVAVCGQETMIVRSWSEFFHRGRHRRALGVLWFGLGAVLAGAMVVSTALVGFALVFGIAPGLIAALILFLIAQSLSFYTAQAARIMSGIFSGVFHREITWRLLILVVASACLYFQQPMDSETFFYVAAAGILVAVVLQSAAVIRSIPAAVRARPPKIDGRQWSERSFRMWTAAVLDAVYQYLDVIIIALLLSTRDAAAYFAASKLASLFLVLADALGVYSSRRISTLYYMEDRSGLDRMLKLVALVTLVLTMAGLVIVGLAGDLLLLVFGPSYVEQYPLLLMLCVGTAFYALAGPTAPLLLLTGHELQYTRLLALLLGLRYVGVAVLAWTTGVYGAALASTTAMVILSLMLITLNRRLVAVDPSVSILFSRDYRTASRTAAPGGIATRVR